MGSFKLLLVNGAVLTGCAVFDFPWRQQVLMALMLFLPFMDRNWRPARLPFSPSKLLLWGGMVAAIALPNLLTPGFLQLSLYTLLLVALPEEWFFRGYFQRRMEELLADHDLAGTGAIVATSALFALLHMATQGLWGLLVFFPSLVFGWVYQRTRDILLVILLHGLSNMIFFMYLADAIHGRD